ncbi:DUF7508 domain-containing protein [Rhodococcus opacus]|uniref:DUF7508 domain-containing protein n=1 Tax=Rhodococcus opacus TaxID=37919 RepID=UPI001C444189|nr:hypothetical protein [Rhodococcus opacus]MBV6760367.1 hypothetical protein [Rhodococcus opacus]
MSIFMTKPWLKSSADELRTVPVSTGVYEIADADGTVVDIGFAGALEPFGLRSKLTTLSGEYSIDGMQFRYELHVQYQSRYTELVLSHRSRHGALPAKVVERGEEFHGHLSIDS